MDCSTPHPHFGSSLVSLADKSHDTLLRDGTIYRRSCPKARRKVKKKSISFMNNGMHVL